MTIVARFPFTCRVCNRRGSAGESIEWSKADGSAHADCAAAGAGPGKAPAKSKSAPAPRKAPRKREPGETQISRDGGKHTRYRVGETVYLPRVAGGGGDDGHYWTVVEEGWSRANEDMGQYSDYCWADVRPATTEEATEEAARRAEVAAAKVAKVLAAGGMVALSRFGEAVTRGICHSLVPVEGLRFNLDKAIRVCSIRSGDAWFKTADGMLVRQSTSFDDYRTTGYMTPAALLEAVAARVDAGEFPLKDSLGYLARYDGCSGSEIHRARVWLASMRGEVVQPEVPTMTHAPVAPREISTDADVLALVSAMGGAQ